MATFEITRVRTVHPPDSAHEHIDAVELNGNSRLRFPRSTVIADLKNPWGDRYYTYTGGQYAEVVVRGCPYCNSGEYITTLPDTTILNNLLQLPRF